MPTIEEATGAFGGYDPREGETPPRVEAIRVTNEALDLLRGAFNANPDDQR